MRTVEPVLRMIVKTAMLGGMVAAAGCLLFFLGTWAAESLRGYHFPPPWDRGLNAWVYFAMIIIGGVTVMGGFSGAAWHFIRVRRPGRAK